jgi:hypothetical protein
VGGRHGWDQNSWVERRGESDSRVLREEEVEVRPLGEEGVWALDS